MQLVKKYALSTIIAVLFGMISHNVWMLLATVGLSVALVHFQFFDSNREAAGTPVQKWFAIALLIAFLGSAIIGLFYPTPLAWAVFNVCIGACWSVWLPRVMRNAFSR